MKVVDKADAVGRLADYAAEIDKGDRHSHRSQGRRLLRVPIENTDLETIALSSHQNFLDLIERSRARVQIEGRISSEEMRRRLGAT